MLIDVHAHFYHARTPRADWRERNESRLAAGSKIGISVHVASILGSFGFTSPTYFPSPRDVTAGNDALLALQRAHPDRIRGYVCVNPNYTAHARAEIVRCLDAGMIGIKLAASRRESPVVGQRHHDGHRLGEAALSRDAAIQRRSGVGALEERGAHLPGRRLSSRLMRTDCNAFLGAYPWRKVPGTSPDGLVKALDRTAIDVAWITHLPSLFWRDPTEGNAWLYQTARAEKRFKPVPTVHPGLPQWEQVLAD